MRPTTTVTHHHHYCPPVGLHSQIPKIPGPRWSNFVQQHLDNEYIAYVPLIVAFSLIAAFVVAGRPFLTRPYAATTKVGPGAAESC